jgi:hypothetical protein
MKEHRELTKRLHERLKPIRDMEFQCALVELLHAAVLFAAAYKHLAKLPQETLDEVNANPELFLSSAELQLNICQTASDLLCRYHKSLDFKAIYDDVAQQLESGHRKLELEELFKSSPDSES